MKRITCGWTNTKDYRFVKWLFNSSEVDGIYKYYMILGFWIQIFKPYDKLCNLTSQQQDVLRQLVVNDKIVSEWTMKDYEKMLKEIKLLKEEDEEV